MKPKLVQIKVKNDKDEEVDRTFCEVDDKGLPVYVYEDNSARGFDAPDSVNKLKERGDAIEEWRKKTTAAETTLQQFTGLDGKPILPEVVRAALQKVADLDGKKLIDAGEGEKQRKDWEVQWEARVEEAKKAGRDALKTANATIRDLTFGNQIAANPFFVGGIGGDGKKIEPKVLGSPQMWAQLLSGHFEVDEKGEGVFYYTTDPERRISDMVTSREKPSSAAPFLEAIELILNRRPDKEQLYRGTVGTGTGPVTSTTTTTTAVTEDTNGKNPMDLITQGLSSMGL